MAKASKKKLKEPGRPAGAPNRGSTYPRNEECKFRCTEAFNKTIEALQLQDPANKLSKADILHEALQMLAVRKLSKKVDMYWVNRIQ